MFAGEPWMRGGFGDAMTLLAATTSLYSGDGQRKYLTEAERERFLTAASSADAPVRTLCLTLAYTGCRISEALALTANDIQLSSLLIAIRSLKKRGRLVVREVPAPPVLLAQLERVHRLKAAQRTAAATTLLWPWGRTTAWRLVKGVMREAGIQQRSASPKGLRHGFGVHAVRSGVPLNLIQKWLGHENIATTAIYTDVLGPEEREIAARMW